MRGEDEWLRQECVCYQNKEEGENIAIIIMVDVLVPIVALLVVVVPIVLYFLM